MSLTLQTEMAVQYGQYHLTDDATEMPDQGDPSQATPGLYCADGQAYVGCVTFWGPLILECEWLQHPPGDVDLDTWDTVVEMHVHAEGELQARPWGSSPVMILASETGDYGLRLHVRGTAQTNAAGAGRGQPLEEPLETHRLSIWPASTVHTRRELKRLG